MINKAEQIKLMINDKGYYWINRFNGFHKKEPR